MILAEDLLLLLTDDDSGKLLSAPDDTDAALAGALVVDLVARGRVTVERTADRAVVQVVSTESTGDPVLDRALTDLTGVSGTSPAEAMRALQGDHRRAGYERLVERGVLRVEEGRLLGVFPRTRWPAEDVRHEQGVRDAIRRALAEGALAEGAPAEGAPVEPRIRALVGLLHAVGAVPVVVDVRELGLSKAELSARADRVARADEVSAAVRLVVAELSASVAAATMVVVNAAT